MKKITIHDQSLPEELRKDCMEILLLQAKLSSHPFVDYSRDIKYAGVGGMILAALSAPFISIYNLEICAACAVVTAFGFHLDHVENNSLKKQKVIEDKWNLSGWDLRYLNELSQFVVRLT